MKVPNGFFNFDAKDTLRLIIWIVIAAFSLGGLYAQRQSDIARLDAEKAALAARVEKVEKVAELATVAQTAVVTAIRGLEVEVRYTNEKIDTMRTELRERR